MSVAQMNNFSNSSDGRVFVTDVQWTAYLKALCPYLGLGIFAALANGIILISVLKNKDLRDKYFLVAALAIGDFCIGLAFIFCGSFRLQMISAGMHKQLTTHIACFSKPWNFFYILGFQTTALISVVISFERLVAVTWPIKYYQVNSKLYVKLAVAAALLYECASLAVAAITAYPETTPVFTYCLITDAMSDSYATYNYGVCGICGVATAVIYTLSVIVMRINMRRMAHDASASKRLKSQAKVTTMMAVVLCVHFILVALPNFGFLVAITLHLNYDILNVMVPYLADAGVLNSGLNFIFYAIYNADLRAGFLSVFGVRRNKVAGGAVSAINTGGVVMRVVPVTISTKANE